MKTLLGSIVLIATGVTLAWGVNTSVSGISVNTIGGGLILIGLVVALAWLIAWARRDAFGHAGRRREDQTLRGIRG